MTIYCAVSAEIRLKTGDINFVVHQITKSNIQNGTHLEKECLILFAVNNNK